MFDAPLNRDVLCVHCRYNLRGLLPTAACPECGRRIDDSLHGNRLRFADRRWLRRLAWGARLFPFALVLRLCDLRFEFADWREFLMFVLLRMPAMVALLGLVLLTAPEPGRVDVGPIFSARRLTRWFGVTILTVELVPHVWSTQGIMTPWLSSLGLMASAAWIWCGGKYAAEIGERLPRLDLVRQVRWVSLVLAGALVGLGVLSVLAPWIATPVSQAAPSTPGGWSVQLGGRSYQNPMWLATVMFPLVLAMMGSGVAMLVLVFALSGSISTAWTKALQDDGPSP